MAIITLSTKLEILVNDGVFTMVRPRMVVLLERKRKKMVVLV